MKKFLKGLGWVGLGIAGIVIWYSFPEIQPVVLWGAGAAFAYHLISTIVQETMRAELAQLREQSRAHTVQLEDIERKVSVILRDALERRRSGV